MPLAPPRAAKTDSGSTKALAACGCRIAQKRQYREGTRTRIALQQQQPSCPLGGVTPALGRPGGHGGVARPILRDRRSNGGHQRGHAGIEQVELDVFADGVEGDASVGKARK